MGYQSAATEAAIVQLRGGRGRPGLAGDRSSTLSDAPETHPDVRVGSSVRGAIDLVGIAGRLGAARGVAQTDWHAGLDAALVALSGRIRLLESCTRPPEDVVRELYDDVFGPPPAAPDSDPGPEGRSPGEA